MTTKEELSALIDAELDELSERRAMDALGRDKLLRDAWGRYHLIRAAMTRQLDVVVAPGLPERILARLESVPPGAVNAPLRFWPLAAGFAAAASVAAIALLTLTTLQQPVDPTRQGAAVASVSGVAPASTPVTVTASSAGSVAAPEDRLNPYLVGHNEFMPTAGMGGMLPYVRVVAHQQDK